MAILIDPPRWPAHGTVFSHLVSDSSLAELHSFAQSAGVSPRAFDRDHYDVPARRYQELVVLGAQEVSGGDLIRRLRASGLRVPPRQRPDRVRGVLRIRWDRMLAGADEVRDDLLGRWSQPHRRYHGVGHLLAVLEALELLTPKPPAPRAVLLAAWFHDAIYDGVPGTDEEASALLAEHLLPTHVPAAEVAEVARLVRLTAAHDPAESDLDGALLSDADLAILGAAPATYDRYVAQVREDYMHVSDADWRAGRAAVLRQLLALDPLFRTTAGRQRWQDPARANLRRELTTLQA